MIRSPVEAPLAALHSWMCRYSDCPVGWRLSAFGHFRASPRMFEFWQVHSGTSQLRSWTVDQILVLSGVSWSWNEDGDGWLPPLRTSGAQHHHCGSGSHLTLLSRQPVLRGILVGPNVFHSISSQPKVIKRWKVPGAEIWTLMFQFLINLPTKSGLLIIDWDEDDLWLFCGFRIRQQHNTTWQNWCENPPIVASVAVNFMSSGALKVAPVDSRGHYLYAWGPTNPPSELIHCFTTWML